MKQGIIIFAIIFLSLFALGYRHGSLKANNRKNYENIAITHLDILQNKGDGSIFFQYGCKGNPYWTYDIDSNKTKKTSYNLASWLKEADSNSAFSLSVSKEQIYLFLSAVALSGYGVKDIIKLINKQKQTSGYAKTQKHGKYLAKAKKVAIIAAGIVSGYLMGRLASKFFAPDCKSEKVLMLLEDDKFWKDTEYKIWYLRWEVARGKTKLLKNEKDRKQIDQKLTNLRDKIFKDKDYTTKDYFPLIQIDKAVAEHLSKQI